MPSRLHHPVASVASHASLWDVFDPSTTLSQCVKADTATAATSVAWTRWYGAPPSSELDYEAYANLGTTYAGPAA